MKKYISTSAFVLSLCFGAEAQNFNAGPLHLNGSVYDASASGGSILSPNSSLLVGSGGNWLFNQANVTTPRLSVYQTELVKFAGGTYSRTTGFIDGYSAAESQTAGFVLPIGHSTYRPLTVHSPLSPASPLTAAWFDDQPLASVRIGNARYYFLPGYYDLNATGAGVSVTPTAPPEATVGTSLLGTVDGNTFVDLGAANAAVTLPAGNYQLRFANASYILPLMLTAFTASPQGTTGLLRWTISSEQEVASYTIERSADGHRYIPIGSLPSLGNTTLDRTYTLHDALPLKGVNYYRLRIIETDGKVIYSEVRMLNFDASVSITVYPNPAAVKATITGLETGVHVTIISMQGQILASYKATGNTLEISMHNLPAALYELRIYDATGKLAGSYRLQKE